MTYVYQEFPKWKYHQTKEPVVVADAEEEARLGDDWQDRPVNWELEQARIRAQQNQRLPHTDSRPRDDERLLAQLKTILERKGWRLVPPTPFTPPTLPTPSQESLEKLMAIIRASPGLTQNQVFKRAQLSRNRCCALLNQHAGILWKVERKGKRTLCYHPLS